MCISEEGAYGKRYRAEERATKKLKTMDVAYHRPEPFLRLEPFPPPYCTLVRGGAQRTVQFGSVWFTHIHIRVQQERWRDLNCMKRV